MPEENIEDITKQLNFANQINANYKPATTTGWLEDYGKNGEDGSIIVFDDSFEHEVVHAGMEDRYILLIVLKHPDVLYP